MRREYCGVQWPGDYMIAFLLTVMLILIVVLAYDLWSHRRASRRSAVMSRSLERARELR